MSAKMSYLCTMRTTTPNIPQGYAYIIRYMMWLLMIYSNNPLYAQTGEAGDSIRINPKFMEELNRAFTFDPIAAPIEVPDDVLTREQLHQWVGPADETDTNTGPSKTKKYDPTDPNRFDSTYFALKMYLVDFCKWQPTCNNVISIPGLGALSDGLQHYGKHVHSTKSGGIALQLDVNALAKYVRPSQIRLRKSRALAEKSKPLMDKFFPIEGSPLYSTEDTLTLGKK